MNELESIIELRHRQLVTLLELVAQQGDAIAEGAMSELLRLLAEKSPLAASFVKISQRLTQEFESSALMAEISAHHRAQHEQCNALHRELLASEAKCEAKLSELRARLSERGAGSVGMRSEGEKAKAMLNEAIVGAASQRPRADHARLSRGDRLDLSNGG